MRGGSIERCIFAEKNPHIFLLSEMRGGFSRVFHACMYIDVSLPLPVKDQFTYHVPPEKEGGACVGGRVVVPFGRSKLYTGIVLRIHDTVPDKDILIKDAVDFLDETPAVLPRQLALWKWMSHYYMCTLGDLVKTALPSGMKIESETRLSLNTAFENWENLTKRENALYELIQEKQIDSVAQLQKEMKSNGVLSLVKSLMEKGALAVQEELKRKFAPKTETHVRIGKDYRTPDTLEELKNAIGKQPKRCHLLSCYIEKAGVDKAEKDGDFENLEEVSRAALLRDSGISPAVLSGMIAKGYFEQYDYEVGRLDLTAGPVERQHTLSAEQQQAYDSIKASFCARSVCLLHGVTSSGKTEIYIKLIQDQTESGKQVLYLLPEIALTTQITERLRKVFGDKLGIYHSGYTDNERVEIWRKQLSDHPFQIILGARSSMFLPFQNLGLVIVDEEHESSYKQQDPVPRYNARDTSIVLASQYKAKVLLGSATPSMESYHNAQTGKYGYVYLGHRFGNIQLPCVEIIDTKDLRKRKMMPTPFSPRLQEEMRKTLKEGGQVILFHNRRGYTPVLECRKCGWVPTCQFCDVSLTYHQNIHKLVCHYCGATYDVPRKCPCCEEQDMGFSGFGTEKIEEEVHKFFPEARTARLDFDSTRTRHSYERILEDFACGKTDVLIGTQMVSKGLDFDRVRVVGILDADTMLARPDFRAFERSFQMISQVAGRAGRRTERGYVILQTKHPEYSVVRQIVDNDYDSMYREQLKVREEFRYPPFYRLIHVVLRHRDDRVAGDAALFLASVLRQSLGENILGPDRPVISRIRLMYIRNIIVKVAPSYSPHAIREILARAVSQTVSVPRYRTVDVYFDVDPL